MNRRTDKTMIGTYILGTGESEHLERESRQKRGGEMNEPDLPGFRGAFQRVEVTIDHKNDKVSLFKRRQRNHPCDSCGLISLPMANKAMKLKCLRLLRCLRNERGAKMSMMRQSQTRLDKAQSGRRVSGDVTSRCMAATTLGIKLLTIIR